MQRALVLEDYAPPALRVRGFVSRKKGARNMGEEKKEGEKKNIYIKLTGKINLKKKEENKHNIKIKKIIMWGLVMLVHAWRSSL